MRIRILEGKLEGHSFEMNGDNLLIGRAPESDIRLPDPSISKLHAKIFKSGKKYFIKDLKSCSGTWVDGKLIWPGNKIELKQGHRLSVGDTLLTLDKFDSENSSAFSYSIDLSSLREQENLNFLLKDNRIANRKDLELICGISEALLHPLELKDICEKILEYIFCSLKRVSSCSILMVDKNNKKICKLMDKARDPGVEGDLDYSHSIVRRVINEGNALMIKDLDYERAIEPFEDLDLAGIKSIMCVPLLSKMDIIGALYAHSNSESDGFSKDDLHILVALGQYASIAIDNATQYATIKQNRNNMDIQNILRHKLEAMKILAGVLSHDLNNLLMHIQGETSLLQYDMQKGDPNERINQIEQSIVKGAELSSLACGYPVAPQNLKRCANLYMLVADSLNKCAHVPDSSFQLESTPDLWPVDIDERQILYALSNLYSFFVSTKKRGIINIRCENIISDSFIQELTGIKGDRLVMISIGDRSTYLDKNDLLEIFTSSINPKNCKESKTKAGLTSAYWIIEQNMGRLVVISDKERGTEFCIYLPAEKNQAEGV